MIYLLSFFTTVDLDTLSNCLIKKGTIFFNGDRARWTKVFLEVLIPLANIFFALEINLGTKGLITQTLNKLPN
jgi:hypothetical protein